MSNDPAKSPDLTPTISELGPHHAEVWHLFTRAIVYVGGATAVTLVGMWLFLYYI